MRPPPTIPTPTKRCTVCGEVRPVTEFWRRGKEGKIRADCKLCARAANSKWYSAHPTYNRHAQLKYNYGISMGDYEAMLVKQNRSCAICDKTIEDNGKWLAVDHNHETGEVRALLCDQCNCGLGNFNENKLLMLRAIQYLEQHCDRTR